MNNYSSFGFSYDSNSQHDTAQICLSGHVVNEATRSAPDLSSKFCKKCGQPTIEQCPSCAAQIKGRNHALGTHGTPSTSSTRESRVPLYCYNCGKYYPWTQTTLDTAKELLSEEDLTPEDKAKIAESLPDIITQTPRTPLAATRIRKVVDKMSGVGKEGFEQLLSDITTESAKRLIWTP